MSDRLSTMIIYKRDILIHNRDVLIHRYFL